MAKTVRQRELSVDGMNVTVQEKRIHSISVRVKPPDGRVVVSAPLRTPLHYIEQIVRERRDWIEKARKRIAVSPMAQAESATPEEVREWRILVEALVPGLIAHWEPILGVKAGPIAYRNMKSRWGSCQPATGRICINVRLALFPRECLEYVVVHELCHLLVSGHGPEFHAIMTRVMPDWKERCAKLK